jgi:DNA-binding NarL/FixJ family response regulator
VQLIAPDAAVVEIRMPPSFTVECLDAARRIARIRPGTGVLVLSQYLESGYAVELLTDAPRHVGYLLKDHIAEGTILVDALSRLAAGDTIAAKISAAQIRLTRDEPQMMNTRAVPAAEPPPRRPRVPDPTGPVRRVTLHRIRGTPPVAVLSYAGNPGTRSSPPTSH